MFGRRPRVPVDFYFPTVRDAKPPSRVDEYVATVNSRLKEAYVEARKQTTAEAARQKRIYDRKANATILKPGDTVLIKDDAVRGRQKIKNRWSEKSYVVDSRVGPDVPTYRVKVDEGRLYTVHRNRLLLIAWEKDMEETVDLSVRLGKTESSGVNQEENTLTMGEQLCEESTPQIEVENSNTPGRLGAVPLGWLTGYLCTRFSALTRKLSDGKG